MTTEAKVVLTGDDSPLRRSLASARENLNRFGADAASPFAKLRDSMGNLGNIMAGIGAVKLIGLADQAALIQARLKDVTGSILEGQQAQGQLFAASQRLQVSYSDMAGSFSKMLPAVKEMGGGANEAVRLAEILATTAKLSGASSSEASASAQQFAQALQSGVLQGDELKSILENNGTLARALAGGLGVTVGELRKLGEQGELTSDKVSKALLGQYDEIQARSAELPATVGGAWQQVTNSFEQFVASSEVGGGVFAGVSAVLSGMSRFIDAVRAALGGASTESDKLARNNSIKAWGEAVGATFAYVVDLARAVWEAIQATGRAIGALAAAAVTAAQGQFADAANIMRMAADDASASWERIKNLGTGGKGSTLFAYATNAGIVAADTSPMAELSGKGGGKGKGKGGKAKGETEDPSRISSMEIALEAQKTYLIESGKLLDKAKEYEIKYWEDILAKADLTEKERLAISKKTAQLKLESARQAAKDERELALAELEHQREMQLLEIELQREQTQTELQFDQITKSESLERQIAFEERRLAIILDYIERRKNLQPGPDDGGAGREKDAENKKSQIAKEKLTRELKKENVGLIDVDGAFKSMGDAAVAGFSRMELNAQKWRQSMLGIFNSIRAAFMRSVVEEPLQAQITAWARQLALKLGFVTQEKALDATGAATTVAVKAGETSAVVGMNAVQAGTGAAASQAPIPVVGPYMALAAMGAIFAAVSAMGGRMKSARNGYDIPAGVNPITQLHEEEMVLPKEQANAIRDLAGSGGGAQGVSVVYNDHSGKLSDSEIRRKASVIAQELSRVHRNGWRTAS